MQRGSARSGAEPASGVGRPAATGRRSVGLRRSSCAMAGWRGGQRGWLRHCRLRDSMTVTMTFISRRRVDVCSPHCAPRRPKAKSGEPATWFGQVITITGRSSHVSRILCRVMAATLRPGASRGAAHHSHPVCPATGPARRLRWQSGISWPSASIRVRKARPYSESPLGMERLFSVQSQVILRSYPCDTIENRNDPRMTSPVTGKQDGERRS